jgi:hypothetical protein
VLRAKLGPFLEHHDQVDLFTFFLKTYFVYSLTRIDPLIPNNDSMFPM